MDFVVVLAQDQPANVQIAADKELLVGILGAAAAEAGVKPVIGRILRPGEVSGSRPTDHHLALPLNAPMSRGCDDNTHKTSLPNFGPN